MIKQRDRKQIIVLESATFYRDSIGRIILEITKPMKKLFIPTETETNFLTRV